MSRATEPLYFLDFIVGGKYQSTNPLRGNRLLRVASRRLVLIGVRKGSLLSFDEVFRYCCSHGKDDEARGLRNTYHKSGRRRLRRLGIRFALREANMEVRRGRPSSEVNRVDPPGRKKAKIVAPFDVASASNSNVTQPKALRGSQSMQIVNKLG
jgi:hypothetical protein